jgi:hypothetical protein
MSSTRPKNALGSMTREIPAVVVSRVHDNLAVGDDVDGEAKRIVLRTERREPGNILVPRKRCRGPVELDGVSSLVRF